MSRNRGTNTKPEILLRKALWRLGLRYQLNSKLPGKPDLVFPGRRTVIFVDGCFWHGCPDHFQSPRTNAPFWRIKIAATQQRDIRTNEKLEAAGWTVLRIWEHDIKADLVGCVTRLKALLAGA
jgi:DNA mismatch endonuclease (patch repair protein)